MKSRDKFEGEIAEVVDKPAAILGLNKKITRRRLQLYWPNHHWYMPGSMVNKLAADGEWEELAEKILTDLESLNAVFADQKMKTQYGEEKYLQDIMRDAIEQVKRMFFDLLEMKGGQINYCVSRKAEELVIDSPRRRAVVAQKEAQQMMEELREMKGLLQESHAVLDALGRFLWPKRP